MKNWLLFIILTGLAFVKSGLAQNDSTSSKPPIKPEKADLRYNINEDGSRYIRLTLLNQAWVRFNDNNPGSFVNGNTAQDQTFDISLRRTRFQLMAQITNRIFFYAQFGSNNFNYESSRKFNFFIHDMVCEYAVVPKAFDLGFGLSGWSGPSRYSSPGVAGFLGIDAPLFEQATNDINDQFLRKLSIYGKGKIGKLDYRLAISKPFIVQTDASPLVGAYVAVPSLGKSAPNVATFSTKAPEIQFQGYLMYQFLDQETNQIPYTQGTYLGKKSVFNIGGGFVYQNNAMWYKTSAGDTLYTPIRFLSVDIYYDRPLNKEKGTAISFYGAFMSNYYGPNYIMNRGINNPADQATKGVTSSATTPNSTNISGGGNSYALAGTGNTYYAQIGYLFQNSLLNSYGTLLPYADIQLSKYEYYKDYLAVFDLGINWLLKGHNSKFTLNYQNHPVFGTNNDGDRIVTTRKGTVTLQYQVFF